LLGAGPAASSGEMRDLLGTNNFPFFSVAIAQVLEARYFHWHLACSFVALLHLVAEWLYFGKYPQKLSLALLLGLCLLGVTQNFWLQPRLRGLHQLEHSRPHQRETVSRAFQAAAAVSTTVNALMLGG